MRDRRRPLVLPALLALGVLAATVGTAGAAAPAVTVRGPGTAVTPAGWLDIVNGYRRDYGVPAVTENATWSRKDRLHARYAQETGTTGHSEDPRNRWYTPDGHEAARNSNVASGSTNAAADIAMWMAGPFHALGILRPQTKQMGFGRDRSASALWVLGGDSGFRARYPRTWPGGRLPLQLTRYSGNEWPDPVRPCPAPRPALGWGLPLIAAFGPGHPSPRVTSATLVTGTRRVPLCVTTAASYPKTWNGGLEAALLREQGVVLVIPREPLVRGARYTLTVATAGSGTAKTLFGVGVAVPPPAPAPAPTVPTPSPTTPGPAPTGSARAWQVSTGAGFPTTFVPGQLQTYPFLVRDQDGPAAGVQVALEFAPAGSEGWIRTAPALTSADGSFAPRLGLGVPLRHELRLVVLGVPEHASAVSTLTPVGP